MRNLKRAGSWVRKRREALGLSAMALARKAGLSVNYISVFERGERLPHWETARKIADALESSNDERTEFFRLIEAAGKPSHAADLTAGIALPGLVLWRQFPESLYGVRHEFLRWRCDAPDDIASQAVRAAGSLLAWVALVQKPPPRAMRGKIIDLAAAMVRERGIHGPRPADTLAADELASIADAGILCEAWRRTVFGDARRTATLVRELKQWLYREEPGFCEPGLLTFRFRRPALARHYDVELVAASCIVEVHDALLVHGLWDALGLGDGDAGLPSGVHVRWMPRRLADAIVWLRSEFSAEKLRRSLVLPAGDENGGPTFDQDLAAGVLQLTRLVRMGARAFEVPELAYLLLEEVAPSESDFVQRIRQAAGPRLGMVVDLSREEGAPPGVQTHELDDLRHELLNVCATAEAIIQEVDAAHFERRARPLDEL